MFKINIYLKLALIVLFLVGGTFLAFYQGFWYAFPLLLIGIILLASYFLLGTVLSAGDFLQKMDYAGAEKRLGLTVFPKLLYVTNRAVYYILKGSIEGQKGNNKLSEEYFHTALELDLPSDNEKGMVLMQLANLQATKGNLKGANNYFNQVKKLNITQREIKDQIDYFGKALKQNQASMKTARSMGKSGHQMMSSGKGGKRRRPKMR